MGSGKSTVGRILARELGTFFVDSDSLIEAREGMDIATIFAQKGEPFFREQEQECLNWIRSSLKGSVVSTGGGLPVHAKGIEKAGEIVFLKSDIETLIHRIEADSMTKRPLAERPDRLREIYGSRLAIYEDISNISVDANREPQEVAASILTHLFPNRTA